MTVQLAWVVNNKLYRVDTNNTMFKTTLSGVWYNGQLRKVDDNIASKLPYYQPGVNYANGQYLLQYDPSKFVVVNTVSTIPSLPKTTTQPVVTPTNDVNGWKPPTYSPPTNTGVNANGLLTVKDPAKPSDPTITVVDIAGLVRTAMLEMIPNLPDGPSKDFYVQGMLNTIAYLANSNSLKLII